MTPHRIYGGDLETDNDGNTAWVVQWAISDGSTECYGPDLQSFSDRIVKMIHEGPSFVYFHNLKYDLAFFKYALKDICDRYNFELRIIMRAHNPISISILPPKNSGMHKLTFRDSMKKNPGNLKSLAKTIGMVKLDGFEFFEGWSKAVDLNVTENWDYVRMDARIVAVAMQTLHALGNDRATFSGDAWARAKAILGADAQGKPYRINFKWETYFPKLEYILDSKLRKGYSGGINISCHRKRSEGVITHADVNSMYPSVMYYDRLPHGIPTYSQDAPNSKSLFIIHGRFKFQLREGMIPWYQFRNGLDNALEGITTGTPVSSCAHYHDLTLTSVDLETLQRWYEVDIDTEWAPEYWIFKFKVGIFREYIEFFLDQKKSAEKGSMEYTWSKFMLNSLYGRFGLNPESQDTELGINDDGNLDFIETAKINEDNDAYLPYAMFITSHARRRLLDYVEKCGPETVIHCDTDSVIHYGGLIKGIDYGKDLGQWGVEDTPLMIYEGGFKRYLEVVKGEVVDHKAYHMACAGVPQRVNSHDIPIGMWVEILDDPDKIMSNDLLGNTDYKIKSVWLRNLYLKDGLDADHVNTMKLIPVSVPGGLILEPRQHKLNDGLRMRGRF